jgi:hypothetical protein
MRPAGEPHGCYDQPPPEDATEYQLSRVLDLLDAAKQVGIDPDVFRLLPERIKLEFNYSKWSYVPNDGRPYKII